MGDQSDEMQAKAKGLLDTIESVKIQIDEQLSLALEAKIALDNEVAKAQAAQLQSANFSESAQQQLNQINAILPQVKTASDDVKAYTEKAQTDSAQLAELARIADEKDKRVTAYEKQLSELNKEFEEFNEKLKNLLPAATGVGLAKSFNDRKVALRYTMFGYLALFLLVICGFIGVGIWALNADIKTFREFSLFVLERTPIIAGLILLEEFSRRQFAASVKLEEDYAYKESISIAFDGFKNAMTDIDITGKETLANTFSSQVIRTLGERPGRLMEVPDANSKITEDALLALTPESNQPASISGLIKDVRANVKKTGFTIGVIILITLGIGCAAGYYFSVTHQNIPISTSINITPNEQTK